MRDLPTFITWPPVRSVPTEVLGKVLADIESHMPAGHAYRDADKITWGHETTHGINANVRMGKTPKQNGFYLLDNTAILIDEPSTTIRQVAQVVPLVLRGKVYKLYLIDQARSVMHFPGETPWGKVFPLYAYYGSGEFGSWNNRPLYLMDEWVAYANGTEIRLDLGIVDRAETVEYMLEFSAYCLCLGISAATDDPQFLNFMAWHFNRCMILFLRSKNLGDISRAEKYLGILRTHPTAQPLRDFALSKLGIRL